jgi:flagellar biosynthetic protein FliQ
MTPDTVSELGRTAMMVTLFTAGPMLLAGLLVGLTISVLQSVTQIQEITLTFVPKIVAVMAAFVIFLPWMMATVLDFVRDLFGNMDTVIR